MTVKEGKHIFGLVLAPNHQPKDRKFQMNWDSKCALLIRKIFIIIILILFFSLDPIRKYDGETITLELPGDMTISEIDWISVYDLENNKNFGSVLIPNGLNVPPSLIKIQQHTASLPNCRQLHKDFRVSWEVFGPQITIQLAGQVMEDEYMSFGLSGSETSSQMLGADVVVAYIAGARGYATDYNITSLAPVCTFYTNKCFLQINLIIINCLLVRSSIGTK